MRRLRWLTVLVAILLLGTLGVAAWTYAHRGYPYSVYFTRVSVTDNSPYWAFGRSTVVQEWSDPPRQRDRMLVAGLPVPIDRVTREGKVYDLNADTSALFSGSAMRQWLDSLVQRGCPGINSARLAHTAGPPVHMDIGSGYSATVRCTRYQIQPGALPATFFDPPRDTPPLWERTLTWLSDHLSGR